MFFTQGYLTIFKAYRDYSLTISHLRCYLLFNPVLFCRAIKPLLFTQLSVFSLTCKSYFTKIFPRVLLSYLEYALWFIFIKLKNWLRAALFLLYIIPRVVSCFYIFMHVIMDQYQASVLYFLRDKIVVINSLHRLHYHPISCTLSFPPA